MEQATAVSVSSGQFRDSAGLCLDTFGAAPLHQAHAPSVTAGSFSPTLLRPRLSFHVA